MEGRCVHRTRAHSDDAGPRDALCARGTLATTGVAVPPDVGPVVVPARDRADRVRVEVHLDQLPVPRDEVAAALRHLVPAGVGGIDAEELVSQMILGSAHLMRESDKTPAELREAVTSKGGTTERALGIFREGDLAGLVSRAVEAAYQRAKELGN